MFRMPGSGKKAEKGLIAPLVILVCPRHGTP